MGHRSPNRMRPALHHIYVPPPAPAPTTKLVSIAARPAIENLEKREICALNAQRRLRGGRRSPSESRGGELGKGCTGQRKEFKEV